MKAKTEVAVICSQYSKVTAYTGKVTGEILNPKPLKNGGIEMGIEYRNEDEEILLILSKTYSPEEVESLWQAIKDEVDSTLNPVLLLNEAMKYGLRVKMAETFGLTVSQILEA